MDWSRGWLMLVSWMMKFKTITKLQVVPMAHLNLALG